MNLELVFEALIERIIHLEFVTRRLAIRSNNLFREGEVTSVDFDSGLASVNAHGVETQPSPWLEQAGDINEWNPLTEGQRVIFVSPDGDLTKGFILKGGYTDSTPQPHNKGAQKRTTIGNTVFTQTDEGFFFEVGGVKLQLTAKGLEQVGGKQLHDGKNVGSSHVHGGVDPGGSNTSAPSN